MKEKKIKYRRDRKACLIEAAVEASVLQKKGAKVRQKLNSDQEEIFRLLQVARSDCKQHNWKKLLLVLNSIGKRLYKQATHWMPKPAPPICPNVHEAEGRLDQVFIKAFETNHPAMRDWVAIKFELKKLRTGTKG